MTTLITSTTLTSGYQLLADSTGTLVIQTGSTPTTAMTINASQNVGIGTSSPSGKLHVESAGTNYIYTRNSVAAGIAGVVFQNAGDTRSWRIDGTNLDAYDNSAGATRMRIDASGRFTLASQPFFYASLTVAQTGYNSSSTGDVVVVYNTTTTNTGSHFNTSTGKFTAPVAGNYIFYASAYASASSFTQNWLVVNGSRITGTDWVHASSTMSIGFWLIRLAANDTVGFHAYNGAVTSATININSEHTYFRGYLLS